MERAIPKNLRRLIKIQDGSNSDQTKPCLADVGCAWWLLCQPSPKVISATHQLLRESSMVSNRRVPHMWVPELMSQVECRPITTRRQMPHSIIGKPPIASRSKPRTT